MRTTPPSVQSVLALPPLLAITAPDTWRDRNGHVNVQHYHGLYDQASWPLMASVGVDAAYFQEAQRGLFDLEHHVWYFAEVLVGDELSVHARFVARSEKRFHGLMFIVNRSRGQVASALEYLSTGADLRTRRTAPLAAELQAGLDRLINEHSQLDWSPPLSGAISS